MTDDLVSIVVVDYNAGDALRACLKSIVVRDDVESEVVVVANGEVNSCLDDESGEVARVRVLKPGQNLGFAAGANLGLAAARGRWLALVNPDTVIPTGALGQLVSFLKQHPKAAAVSPVLRWPDGAAQPYWYGEDPSPENLARRGITRAIGAYRPHWEVGPARQVDWVSGACLVARHSALDAVGPLDERFFVYFEDVDWCWRARRAGWEIWIDPAVSAVHRSRPDHRDLARRRLYEESLRAFYGKHYGSQVTACLTVLLRIKEWSSHYRGEALRRPDR